MQMMLGNGFGFNWQGLYVTSMLDFRSAWRNQADELSDTLKNTMLLGHYMVTHFDTICQRAEPGAAAARYLRRGAGALRSVVDANFTHRDDTAAGCERASRGDHPTGLRTPAQRSAV